MGGPLHRAGQAVSGGLLIPEQNLNREDTQGGTREQRLHGHIPLESPAATGTLTLAPHMGLFFYFSFLIQEATGVTCSNDSNSLLLLLLLFFLGFTLVLAPSHAHRFQEAAAASQEQAASQLEKRLCHRAGMAQGRAPGEGRISRKQGSFFASTFGPQMTVTCSSKSEKRPTPSLGHLSMGTKRAAASLFLQPLWVPSSCRDGFFGLWCLEHY